MPTPLGVHTMIRRAGLNETFNPNAIGVGANGNPAFTVAHADGAAVI